MSYKLYIIITLMMFISIAVSILVVSPRYKSVAVETDTPTVTEHMVSMMVWTLYARLSVDPELKHFFNAVDLPRLVSHQILMFRAILLIGVQVPDFDIKAIHAKLDITNHHFDLLMAHVNSVLTDFHVSSAETAKAVIALESYRKDVVTSLD